MAAAKASASIPFALCPDLNAFIGTVFRITDIATFNCANLTVPFDHNNKAADTLEIDLFCVNATQPPSLGIVMINYGGPGGTGSENRPLLAKRAHDVVGAQWDLIS